MPLDPLQSRQVNGRGDHVVGRLAHVHGIIGMNRRPTSPHSAQPLIGDSRDHLVGVHVRRRAAAGLEHIEHELVVVLALGDRLSGSNNRRSELGIEQTQVQVHPRRGLFDQAHGPDKLTRETEIADLKVTRRALSLRPVVSLGGDFHLAHRIVFCPGSGQTNLPLASRVSRYWPTSSGSRAYLASSERPSMTCLILSRSPRIGTPRNVT